MKAFERLTHSVALVIYADTGKRDSSRKQQRVGKEHTHGIDAGLPLHLRRTTAVTSERASHMLGPKLPKTEFALFSLPMNSTLAFAILTRSDTVNNDSPQHIPESVPLLKVGSADNGTVRG